MRHKLNSLEKKELGFWVFLNMILGKPSLSPTIRSPILISIGIFLIYVVSV
jgi:hypothetical protein